MGEQTANTAHQREFYEEIWGNRNLDALVEEFTRIRLDIAGVRPAGRVLDVGAGAGRLAAVAEGAHVTSIDLTLASCAALAKAGGLAVQGDATVLPFRDGAFDVVTILDVIEHLDDPVATLTELCRVLRAGGTLVLTCPNEGVPVGLGLLFWMFIREWPTCDNLEKWDPEHVRRPSVAEVCGQATEAGFEVHRTSTWARSAFSVLFIVLYGVRATIRGRKLSRIGLHPARVDRFMQRMMRLARATDRLLVGDRCSAIVLTARKPTPVGAAARRADAA